MENIIKRNIHKLTLHHSEPCPIKFPGMLDAQWFEDASSFRITFEEDTDGQPISILTGSMDQATLIGLLRRLYGLGLPLISVICNEFVEKRVNNAG